jgi:hypothetical protein
MIAGQVEHFERGTLIIADQASGRLTMRGTRIVRISSLLRATFRRPNQWASGMARDGDDAS